MEKRLLAQRFSLRFATTLHGMVMVNAFFALRFFHNALADFKAEMNTLSYALMHNPHLAAQSIPKSPSTARSEGSGTCCGPEGHILVPIRKLPFKIPRGEAKSEYKQYECNVCNLKTSFACVVCSTSLHTIWPCHPPTTKYRGKVTKHTCLAWHREHPTTTPRGRRTGAKRARGSPREECEECEGEEECESEGEEEYGEEEWDENEDMEL